MDRWSSSLPLALIAALAGAPALAQEAAPAAGAEVAAPAAAPAEAAPPGGAAAEPASKEPSLATMRSSFCGLGGFGKIITPDVPVGHLGRGGFLWQHQNLRFGIAGTEARAQLYVLQGAVGLLEQIEISLSVPVIDYEMSSKFKPLDDQDAGTGNPEIGFKYSPKLGIDMISLAAYGRWELPWGEYGVFRPERFPYGEGKRGEAEMGGSVGADFGIASAYMNLGFRFIEGGDRTFRYRFGFAIRPSETFEAGLYWDGEEFEGTTGSNGFFGLLATANLGPVYLSAGLETMLIRSATDDIWGREVFRLAHDHSSAWTIYWSLGIPF